VKVLIRWISLCFFLLVRPLQAEAPQSPPLCPHENRLFSIPDDKGFQCDAPQAILYDLLTHTVLYEKDPEKSMVPSSMTKVLFAYMLFDALQQGTVGLKDSFSVSERAWRFGGSKMFVELGTRIGFEDLLRGVIVHSGNDACVVLAEGLAGSEEAFVKQMNSKAAEMGATGTNFLNTTGWPQSGHVSTCRDLLLFAIRTLQDFPDFYKTYYGQKEFTHHGIRQRNRNPLLHKNVGSGIVADGLKTGHTEEGGYGFVGSAIQEGRRIVFVMNGLPNEKARAQVCEQILRYGLEAFQVVQRHPAHAMVARLPLPETPYVSVTLVTPEPIALTVPRTLPLHQITERVSLLPGIRPPLAKGQQIATLTLSAPGMSEKVFPLCSSQAIEQLGFLKSAWLSFVQWLKSLGH
jgi:D-alanyl-D-alanine carboxypeptidase (penicillin-binding protein 5/6)